MLTLNIVDRLDYCDRAGLTLRFVRTKFNMAHQSSSGLLANVFSFVSREFESFLLNATSASPVSPILSGYPLLIMVSSEIGRAHV